MYITGEDSYRILFLQKYSLTYRRGGSSAKILFCASKKRQEFQNFLRFFETQKTRGREFGNFGGIDTEYSCRYVLLEVGRVA